MAAVPGRKKEEKRRKKKKKEEKRRKKKKKEEKGRKKKKKEEKRRKKKKKEEKKKKRRKGKGSEEKGETRSRMGKKTFLGLAALSSFHGEKMGKKRVRKMTTERKKLPLDFFENFFFLCDEYI